MRSLLLPAAAFIAVPAAAQDHSSHDAHTELAAQAEHSAHAADAAPAAQEDHPVHADIMPPQDPETAPHEHGDTAEAVTDQPVHPSIDHSAMEHEEHERMDHAAMDHSMHLAEHEGHGPAARAAAPPARAHEGPRHAADAIFGPAAMARSHAENEAMDRMSFGTIMLERFESRSGEGEDHYLWDAQGWYGGDYDKLWLKSEGEGSFDGAVESAEVQALWSHAIGPFFDLQTGMRYDFEPDGRGHAVLGVQGLAPYMFELDAAAFLSDRGDLTARVEAEYDQRITQRLILQPRAEISLSAQDIPAREIGAGITSFETGLRLRYEFAREFAPYLGVGYESKLGDTADFARAAGADPDRFSFLFGLRAWF